MTKIATLLATKDHVNVFLYDGGIIPDPDGIITGGQTLHAPVLRTMLERIIANNRAGGWRKLKRES